MAARDPIAAVVAAARNVLSVYEGERRVAEPQYVTRRLREALNALDALAQKEK